MGVMRAVAWDIIQVLAGEGYGPGRIYSELRKTGHAYRKQQVLADARQATGRVRHQSQIEELSDNRYVPRDWMGETDFAYNARYRVRGKSLMYDTDRGQYYDKYYSMYTNRYLKKEDIQSEFMAQPWNKEQSPGQQMLNFRPLSVEHHAGWSY